MSILKNLLLFFAFNILFTSHLNAQQLFGVVSSNYAGTDAIYLNPSSIASSKHIFFIDIFSFQSSISNNYVKYKSNLNASDFYKLIAGQSTLKFDQTTLQYSNDGKPKSATAAFDLRFFPSFMVRITPKISVAFTARVRGALQMNNVDEKIAVLFVNNSNLDQYLNKLNDNTSFAVNANLFSEVGLTYAQTILDNDVFQVKGGITVKRMAGLYSSHLISNNLTFTLNKEPDPNVPVNQQTVANIQNLDIKYGYTTADAFDFNKTSSFDWITGKGFPGNGLGMDIGGTFIKKSDDENIPYKFRIGAALVDMGKITYKNDQGVTDYNINRKNKKLVVEDFQNAQGSSDYTDAINKVLDVQPSEKSTSFSTGLPTTFNVSFDYNIIKKVFVNATLVQGLRNKSSISMRPNSQFAITPRLETKGFELAIPLLLTNNYKNFSMGLAARFGTFFVGSDNIGGVIGLGKPYGMDVYAGFRIGILGRNKQTDPIPALKK